MLQPEPMARKTKPAASEADSPDLKSVKFAPVEADDVELAGRHRSSKFGELKNALEEADVGDSFLTDSEGDDDKGRAQYRITLYAYMGRFGILVSCRPTKDGRILVTKRDPKTKRIVTRKRKAS